VRQRRHGKATLTASAPIPSNAVRRSNELHVSTIDQPISVTAFAVALFFVQ
jgi:hypothetical protein